MLLIYRVIENLFFAILCDIMKRILKYLYLPMERGIVMNTKDELNKAFDDLNKGTFIQDKISY